MFKVKSDCLVRNLKYLREWLRHLFSFLLIYKSLSSPQSFSVLSPMSHAAFTALSYFEYK